MKSFYTECTISFIDNTEKTPFSSSETYSFIIEAKNKKQGRQDAKKRGIEEFENDLGKSNENVKIFIDEFYQTSNEARAH